MSLAEVPSLLDAALTSLGVGLLGCSKAGAVVYLNDVCADLTGWHEQDAYGMRIEAVWRICALDEASEMPQVLVPVGQAVTAENNGHAILVGRDGSTKPIEWRTLTDVSCGQVERLYIFWDITPLNEMLVDLHRLAAIVESSNDAIVSKSLTGVVTSWNWGAERLFGYTSAEMIGQPFRQLIPPDRQAEEDDILRRIAAGEKVPPFDTRRLHKEGETIDINVTVSPIYGVDGRVVGASKIARSNAERNKRQKLEMEALRLQAANDRLAEIGRLRRNFTSKMSHELRTPLNAVIGFAQLLHSDATAKGETKMAEGLGHIMRAGQHILQLVNEVLDLAKLESGKFAFSPEVVRAETMVAEVSSILAPLLLDKRMRLVTEVDSELGDLFIDPLRFRQVLYNFLSNAVKFSPKGDVVLLTVKAEGPDKFRVEVRDNGPGIAVEQQASLFTDFTQLSTASTGSDGTGLGLALTRGLVEGQEGVSDFRANRAKGRLFSLSCHGTRRQISLNCKANLDVQALA